MIRTVHTFVQDVPDADSCTVTRHAVVVAVVSEAPTASECDEVRATVAELVPVPSGSGEDVQTAAEGSLAPGDDLHVGGTTITLADAPRTDECLAIAWRSGQIAMPGLPPLTALPESRR